MLQLATSLGNLRCRLHAAAAIGPAVVWVFGAGGGLGGPAGGVYERLAAHLLHEEVTSLQMDYRHPGQLDHCVLDTLAGVTYLEGVGLAEAGRVALVGHSFGGAVVITAGAIHESVAAVAAMSSQTYGADRVSELSPKPLLLVHGMDDEVLPDSCSRALYRAAGDTKELILYPGCRHGLDQCREELDRDLSAWLRRVLGITAPSPAPGNEE
jgi:hypothetical protein